MQKNKEMSSVLRRRVLRLPERSEQPMDSVGHRRERGEQLYKRALLWRRFGARLALEQLLHRRHREHQCECARRLRSRRGRARLLVLQLLECASGRRGLELERHPQVRVELHDRHE